ncbi:hypothetical protein C4E22_03470 [ANME-1 cluster archaeon AG-394-G06]|nr:hypothetical protein [ANME-1 cluster archaeon AG-394-G06]
MVKSASKLRRRAQITMSLIQPIVIFDRDIKRGARYRNTSEKLIKRRVLVQRDEINERSPVRGISPNTFPTTVA